MIGRSISYEYNPSQIDPDSGSIVGKRIKPTAEYFMKAFVNYFGHFPLASGPDSISSLRDESHLVSGDQRPSFFSFLDSHVLSFIPHPPETKGTHLYCVARDSLGRYIWHNQLNYHEKPVQPPEEQQAGVIPDIEIPCSVDETKVIPAICKGMAPDDQKLFEETQRQVEHLRTQEQKMDTSAKPSTTALQAPQVEATSENAVRLFCSHFGFSCLPNWGRFTPTRASTELAKPIDREISRECYSAGILYFDKSGVPCFEMELPKDFNDFIWNVGWPVNMAEHMGYKGGLSPSKTGAMAPYYASYNLEVCLPSIFLSSTPPFSRVTVAHFPSGSSHSPERGQVQLHSKFDFLQSSDCLLGRRPSLILSGRFQT